jgi:hypothetical protein
MIVMKISMVSPILSLLAVLRATSPTSEVFLVIFGEIEELIQMTFCRIG